jgi:hypothetical protein
VIVVGDRKMRFPEKNRQGAKIAKQDAEGRF